MQLDLTKGRIDLLFQIPGRLIVTEWKCYRISFLDIQVDGNRNANVVAKLKTLRDYKLPEILKLRFCTWDRHHQGTIESWVMGNDGPQLKDYIKSTNVQQLMEERSLELQAHLVIIVGSRHILLWDMDKEGNLAAEPHLVQVPSRSNRRDGLGDYSQLIMERNVPVSNIERQEGEGIRRLYIAVKTPCTQNENALV